MPKKPSTKDLESRLMDETFRVESIMDTEDKSRVLKKLVCVLLLAALFMGIEIAGGVISHSIAILSDAAHMLSDLLGFVISIGSVYISGLPANRQHSYGYHRAGIIGALASVLVIWVLTGFLIYYAIERVLNLDQVEVEGPIMFGVACFGLLTNLVMIKVLHGDGHGSHGHSHGDSHGHSHGKRVKDSHDHQHGDHEHENKHKSKEGKHDHDHAIAIKIDNDGNSHDHENSPHHSHAEQKNLSKPNDHENMNVRATIIHIFGDILQSIGVIIASGLIWINPNWKIADPIVTFVFAIIVLYTTMRIIKDCIFVLMEGTPAEINLDDFESKIKGIEGVVEVHDLHVWALGVGKPAMSAHVYTDGDAAVVLKKATKISKSYGIFHSTIQVETTQDKSHANYIECKNNIH